MRQLLRTIARTITTVQQRKAIRRRFERSITARLYAGRTYQCPICRWSFDKLLPGGYHARENARCPRCGAYERHRTLYFLLTELHSNEFRPRSVLHVAPEPSIAEALQSQWAIDEYLTLDLYLPGVDYQCSVTTIPCRDESFDLVICSHVLHLIVNHERAVAELHRVLRWGGILLLQDPYRFDRETIERSSLSDDEIQQTFGRSPGLKFLGTDFFAVLSQFGLDVDVYDPVQTLSAEVREKCRLRETVVVCRKNRGQANTDHGPT